MKSELIVDVQPSEISVALLEDGRLVSLQKRGGKITVCACKATSIWHKVKKLMPVTMPHLERGV